MLSIEGIKHELLNAKNHEREGAIIAQAGRRGAVTIATNMAGRGVDIILGGNPPVKEGAEAVRAAGGLCVIGTERHEARRIDNQLRGRAGRQGDPGDTQFFVSLDDTLMRVFGSDKIKSMMGKFGLPEDEAIENRFISKALESAQAKIEGFNFDTRKHLLEYDDVLNKQRQSIYRRRRAVLFGMPNEIFAIARELVEDDLDDLAHFCANGDRDAWNMAELYDNLKNRFGPPASQARALRAGAGEEKLKFLEDLKKSDLSDEMAREEITEYAVSVFREALTRKQTEISAENFAQGLKILMLQIFDTLWMGHLEIMDYMRSSVRLRAYGQHDPLVEYKNEGSRLFHELEAGVRSHISNMILKVGPPASQARALRAGGEMQVEARRTTESRPDSDGPAESRAPQAVSDEPKVGPPASQARALRAGRNDPCPCGSGKKFKRCHGA
jgi:preprotein translocase subunit SecA